MLFLITTKISLIINFFFSIKNLPGKKYINLIGHVVVR